MLKSLTHSDNIPHVLFLSFIGIQIHQRILILAIVGNAVEHVTAVTVAMKDKMDLAMGVAVGSCTQISLLVVPLTVLVGWITDKDTTLKFPHFEVILFILSVMVVSIVLSKPTCNWLEGSLLMTTHLLIAIGFGLKMYATFKCVCDEH